MMRFIGRLLIVSMLSLSFTTARAGMIGTDGIAAQATAQAERASLVGAMERPEVARQLETLGVDPASAKNRVAAMTDAEVHTLAGQVQALPVGADSGWGWVVLIALAIWAWYSWR